MQNNLCTCKKNNDKNIINIHIDFITYENVLL